MQDEVIQSTFRDRHASRRFLRNAFRHANAKQIEVEIHYDDRRLRVRVRDDSKGIDSEVLSGDGRKGRYGLSGVRERAQLIGGQLTVWSKMDFGTELELRFFHRVPARQPRFSANHGLHTPASWANCRQCLG